MSLLDPRFLISSPFLLDASTLALLTKLPQQQLAIGGGKIVGNGTVNGAVNGQTHSIGLPGGGSFRISDLLDSPSETTSTTLNLSNDAEAVSPRESLESRPSAGASPSDEPHSHRNSPLGDDHLHSSGSKKARKARTIFTDKQLQELESTFEKQKYLSVQDRMELAQRMGLTDTQVKTWYQNRRTKWKRQAAVGIDLLNDANNMAAVQQLLRTNPYWANYLAQSPMSRPLLGALGVTTPAGLLTSSAPSVPVSGTNIASSVATVGLPQAFPIPLLSFLPQPFELPPKTETPNSEKQE